MSIYFRKQPKLPGIHAMGALIRTIATYGGLHTKLNKVGASNFRRWVTPDTIGFLLTLWPFFRKSGELHSQN